MNTVKKSKRLKCPQCGGRGIIIEIVDNGRDAFWNTKRKEEHIDELRLPNMTGTKEQCDEALSIRSRFVQKAKIQYKSEPFKIFIKLISYESHSFFWIWNKDSNIGGLLGQIVVKNPTAIELINRMLSMPIDMQ